MELIQFVVTLLSNVIVETCVFAVNFSSSSPPGLFLQVLQDYLPFRKLYKGSSLTLYNGISLFQYVSSVISFNSALRKESALSPHLFIIFYLFIFLQWGHRWGVMQ